MVKLSLFVLLFSSSLFCQTITGRVLDPQSKPVERAQVRLYLSDSAQPTVVQTDSRGEYRLAAAGAVLLEVEAAGFRRVSVRMEVRGTAKRDVTLELAGVDSAVVVTAEGRAQALDEVAKAVTVVDGAEIRERNEYALFETLRNVPGVQVRNQGGPGQFTQIRMRGLRPDAAQILVDGVRFRDAAALQGDASSFVSALNVVNLGRVEVLRGSGSSLYGTGAVGGSINLVSEQGGGPAHGELLAEGGGLGFLRGRASLSGGFLKNRVTYSGGFQHVNVLSGVDGDDRVRSTGGQGYVKWYAGPRWSVWNRFYATDDFAQLNVSPATTGIPAGNFANVGTVVPVVMLGPDQVRILNQGGRPDYAGVTLVPGRNDPDSHRAAFFTTNLTGVRYEISPRASWQATYQRLGTERRLTNGPGGVGFQPVRAVTESNFRGTIDTVDTRASWRVSRAVSLTGGYEFERELYREGQNNNQPGNARLSTRTRAPQRAQAGFVQSQFSLLQDRLQIGLSGRVQDFTLTRPEFTFTGTANNYQNAAIVSPPRAWTGDVSIAYFLARTGTKLRAHAGNSYRAPSLYERFGGGFFANPATGNVGFTAYGNPALGPDRYNSIDWGVDQYVWRERLRVSATHFYTRIQTVSAFDFSGVVNPRTDPWGRTSGYISGAGGISRGLELGIEARPTRSLTMSGSYTFTNADTDRDQVITGFFRTLNVPPHSAAFVATQRIGRRVDVTFDVFHSSNYFINYFAAGRSRAFDFSGFTKVDGVVAYRLIDGERGRVKLYGKLENVFDRRYYENGVLNPGVWGLVGLTYSF